MIPHGGKQQLIHGMTIHIYWSTSTISGGTASEKRQAEDLIAASCTLVQFITTPTRGSNILNLILGNNYNIIHSYEVAETALSDHKLIKAFFKLPEDDKVTSADCGFRTLGLQICQAGNYNHSMSDINFYSPATDWEHIKLELQQMEWENLCREKNEDSILNIILTKIQEICRKYVPKKSKLRKKREIPRDRRILMRKRSWFQTRISRKIQVEEEVDLLQEDLNRVFAWAEDNNMSLNGDKFELLSFTFTGTRLFNSVPREIRNLTGITPDSFKNKLDKWLATVPDQPPTPGYTSTNSLQSVVHNMRREELPGTSGCPR
ncbi:hypothetical protein Pcinc_025452 [Petrolisthes cinctipes]|uniref:Uncharacterized protein n=1 Tax=Petrolisthes cinctipes TaxID=88211 RepID=A0AAE1FAK5_PETCI|nr:hypothetical protein Pcinc_025452 [Petrolisthes cinctipes]